MQIKELIPEFNKLQNIFWDKNLDAICWAWEVENPDICFVFMNPTWKNIASDKTRKWLKAPWLWTKNIWKMFYSLWFLSKDIYENILNKKPSDWSCDFSDEVYDYIKKSSFYITNLSKATQIDARPLKNSVFKEYLDFFKKEVSILKPKIIITFWNQVSSILLWKNIKVWDCRKVSFDLECNWEIFKVFPVYYPVWQWMRNIDKAKEDIDWIIKKYWK